MIVAHRAFAEDLLAFCQRRLTFNRILGRDREVAEDPRAHKAEPGLAADCQGTVQQVHRLRATSLCASDHGQIVEEVFAAPRHEYTKALFDAAPGRNREFFAGAAAGA